jgi:hypothetical protein
MAIRIRRAAITPSDALRVGSVRTFLDVIEKFAHSDETSFLYRGHPSFSYRLTSSCWCRAKIDSPLE